MRAARASTAACLAWRIRYPEQARRGTKTGLLAWMRPRAVAVDLEESEGEREPGSVEAAEREPGPGRARARVGASASGPEASDGEREGEQEQGSMGARDLTPWGTFAPPPWGLGGGYGPR